MHDTAESSSTPQNPLSQRFSAWLIAGRAPLFLLGIALMLAAWPTSRRLEFDQSIESLYAHEDPRLTDYQFSKRTFGGDEFVFVAFTDPQLMAADRQSLTSVSAQRIVRFANELSRIGGVEPSSTQTLPALLSPATGVTIPLLGDVSSFLPKERLIEMATGVVLGADRETTAIVLRLRPARESPIGRGETIARIRRAAAAFESTHGLPVFIVGEPVQVHDMFRYVEEDGRVLFRVSLGLLAAVLFILFRSPRWVLLSLVIVQATILWTEAAFVLSRLRLSMVSSMLNSLVTIIGIATTTHLTVRYREKRRDLDRRGALSASLAELMRPVFWTTATTACGFISLLSSSITPVRSFGMMMAFATMLVLVASALLIPGGVLLGRRDADPKPTPLEGELSVWLGRISTWVEQRPRALACGFLALTVFAAAGWPRLRVETDFSQNFRDESPIVSSLNFIETRLGGAGNWEVNFPISSPLTDLDLARVRRLTERLRAESDGAQVPQLTKVVALTDVLDAVPEIPLVAATAAQRLELVRTLQPELVSSLYRPEERRMRILLRGRERAPAEVKLRLIQRVETIAREEFPAAEQRSEKPATVTGLYVLLAFLIESLMSDQWISFAWAAGGIVAMISIAFRSLAIGFVALIPNLFPIAMVVGTMAWLNLPINIATAMIASVSTGLTIDSSIHYLSAYQSARRDGAAVSDAIHKSHQGVGRALVFANLALLAGFSVLTLSHFVPLIYFGLLVNLAMIGGLIGNLFLLPLLIRWLDRNRTAPPAGKMPSHEP